MGDCRATTTTHVSKRREQVHDDFIALLNQVKPDEPTAKLFKEIVLRRWNDEFKFATDHNDRLNREVTELSEKKSRIIDLFIDGKLTEAEKVIKLAEIQKNVAALKIQSMEADKYATKKEEIIDASLLFMSEAGLFWNLGDITVKRRVQDAIFPDGVTYDFDSGFGTVKLQLMQTIAARNVENSSLVGQSWYEQKAAIVRPATRAYLAANAQLLII